jgi:DNA-directed RNA polymerase specialized sigma subunit
VTKLPDAERLLLQLRYEQELTLAEIARVMNFKDAFTADRRLRSVLARLQSELAPATKKVTARPCNTV